MAHLAAVPPGRSNLPPSSGVSAPPRKPKRPSEQADPAELVKVEYEEPIDDLTPTPAEHEFEEPSVSPDDVSEFQEPAP